MAEFRWKKFYARLLFLNPGDRLMQTICSSVQEMRALGAACAKKSSRTSVFGLVGDLGTGKTEYVRGFTDALTPTDIVRSPTFTLVNTYQTSVFPIHHFDFYRIKKPSELFDIGFEEYLDNGICLIEWADLFPQVLPPEIQYLRFAFVNESTRQVDML
jgi:tRNA threonylcarbamoyladenosine biosynthesis protein TsaE